MEPPCGTDTGAATGTTGCGTIGCAEIVQTIITLAHNLGLDVTAEGIEEESQLEALQGMGCDFGQGYLFARPLDKDGAEGLLEENRRW